MSICLNMIVKNESKVIERCLASVKHHIDYWVIVDTGSTDGTQEIIRAFLADIPGELIERPWVHFAHNRTEALEYAKGKGDYYLIIDADEVLEAAKDFKWPILSADAYDIKTRFGSLEYYRTQLLKGDLDWHYEGILHEYIHSNQEYHKKKLDGIVNVPHTDGARSSDPFKYKKDALLLENALLEDPDNRRYVFYLAQSYRDAQDYELALRNYEKRVEMGGWDEEVWYALYQIAVIKQVMGMPWEEVLNAYLAAFQFRPSRAEPLYRIMLHYRLEGQYALAHLFAEKAVRIPYPDDVLFIEANVYRYAAMMEYGISSYWVGQHKEAIEANNNILYKVDIPSNVVQQVIINRNFSLDKIYPKQEIKEFQKNKIVVFIPFYNPGNFLDNCIDSLLKQDYDHFKMIFIDDASTDRSFEKIPVDDSRITLVRNEQRWGGAYNIHQCLTRHCEPDDIYVQLDGDDWLACNDALSYINQLYNEYDCEVLYGQFRFANGAYGLALPFSSRAAFDQLRSFWVCPAIRTFRSYLYHKIADQDSEYSCMKNSEGQWFTEAMDVALMCPIFEMAGYEKVRYNDRVLYVYNNENPLNVFRDRRARELHCHHEIAAKKKFTPYRQFSAHETQVQRKDLVKTNL